MKGHKIDVNKRELSNKKSFVKELRRQDQIPGVYYSHDSKTSIPFTVDKKVIHEALKSDAQVYQISVGSKDRDVIIKAVQYHPISDQMLHIDLYGVKMDQEVTLKVPIEITGQSEGIKAGGVLNQTLTELEISCLPGNIPQNIVIDITDLNIGDAIRTGELQLDDTITLQSDTELLVVSILEPTKVEESEELEVEDSIDSETSEGATDENATENSESEQSE
tara:strand:+ start:452 stop:1114 length:663 start_codon:yes stop_codon:yes gene_type:complete